MMNKIHWPTLVPEDDVKAKAKKLAEQLEQAATEDWNIDRAMGVRRAAEMVRETFGLKGENDVSSTAG